VSHLRRFRSTTWIAATCAALSFAPLVGIAGGSSGVSAAVGDVGGSVFRDLNWNGVRDTDEPAVAGLWVKAYGQTPGPDGVLNTRDDSPTVTGPVKTNAAGAWTITGITAEPKVRVEFYGLDENADDTFQPAEETLPGWLKPSVKGTDNRGSVQFVDLGTTTVAYAVANPSDYCQANPDFVTTCFSFSKSDDVNSGNGSLYRTSALSSSTAIRTFAETGATYGLAYRRSANQLFQAAYMKRHSGFGPLGPGGIYRDGVTYVDLNSLPGFNGAGARRGRPTQPRRSRHQRRRPDAVHRQPGDERTRDHSCGSGAFSGGRAEHGPWCRSGRSVLNPVAVPFRSPRRRARREGRSRARRRRVLHLAQRVHLCVQPSHLGVVGRTRVHVSDDREPRCER
jgi:hypothetical protein